MDVFRGAAAAACFLGIIFSALETLIPGERFSKQINVIFSLIMVLTVAAPFVSGDIEFELPELSEEYDIDTDEVYRRNLTEAVQSNLCSEVGELLEKNGIITVKISADVNNFADGSISISKVSVSLSDPKDIKGAKKLLEEAFGEDTETEVYIEGSENGQ